MTSFALADADREWSWSDVDRDLAGIASALVDAGFSGQRIAVIGANSADTLLFYAAAVLAGVGTILVNFHLTADEVHYLLGDGDAAAVWATDEHLVVARAAAARHGVPVLTRDFGARPSEQPPSLDRPAMSDLIYTSGTTGFPKGVEVPARPAATVRDRIAQLASHHSTGLGPHLVAGPLYHAGPHASVGLLLNRTPVVVPGRFDARIVLRYIERFAIATSVMVPTHFVRLLAVPDDERADLEVSSLRLIAQTGSSCPIAVKRAMIEWFGPVFRESYGASESGIISFITSEEWLRRPGSVGRPQPQFKPLVLDDSGRLLGPGQSGRLFFRDTTGRGISYHNDAAKTAAAHLEPGVFTLGDLGYVGEDGYLFVTGRTSDMVISGGVNIYPAECERVLYEHPAVTDAAVFGAPDDEMGERLVAVVAVGDAGIDGAALVAYCRDRIAHYKVPREMRVVSSVPRNAMGKIDKRELADSYMRNAIG